MVLAAVQGPPLFDRQQYCRAWGGCSDAMLARADLLLVAVLVGVLSLLCWLLVILGCCKICLECLEIGISLHSSMSSSLAVIMGMSDDEGVLS